MAGEEPRVRRWRGRLALAVAVCAGAAVLLVLLAHTPPVRRAALRGVVDTLADRFDLSLRADALTYNLFARRAALTGVDIAAIEDAETPFLSADRIEITLPAAALLGRFALDRIHLDNARLAIVRRADGSTNLPAGGAQADPGEPQPIPLRRLDAGQLAVTIADEAGGLALRLPAIRLDIGTDSGELRLTEGGRIERDGASATISELGGGVAFDGRTLRVTEFAVATPQARATLDGALALLVQEPRADLRVDARGDLAFVRPWAGGELPLTGLVAVEGTVEGPLANPAARLRVRGDGVAWQGLTLADLQASVSADAARVDLSDAEAEVAGGAVAASGTFFIDTQALELEAAWRNLDLGTLSRALDGQAALRPAGRATGAATVRRGGPSLADWTIDARTQVAPAAARGIAIPGASTLRVGDGRWQLEAEHRIDAAPLRARVGGRVDADRLAASTLTGSIVLDEIAVADLIALLRAADVADIDADLVTAGRLRADATVAGTFDRPQLDLTASGRALEIRGVRDLAVDLTADGTADQMALNAEVRQGAANAGTATGTVSLARQRFDGHVTARLDDLAALAPDVPVSGRVHLELDAEGAFSAPSARGTITVADAAYESVRLGDVEATLDASPEAALVDLTASELGARGRANVTLTGRRTAAVELAIEDADLERLVRDLAVPAPIRGRVTLDARGEAPLDEWQRGSVAIEVSQLDARVGELPIRLAQPAQVAFENRTAGVERLEADLGSLRLSVTGRLPAVEDAPAVPAGDALRALLVGDIADVAKAIRATGLTELPMVSGRGQLAFVARITGSAARPVVAADLDLADGELAVRDLPPIRGVNLRAHVADGWIAPLTVSGEWQESRVEADARVPLRLLAEYLPADVLAGLPETIGPATLEARARAITPAVVAPFVDAETLAQLDGVVDATARLEAASLEPDSLRGEARLDRLDVQVAGLPIAQRAPTRIVFADGLARIATWDWAGEGATFGVQGQVRLADGEAALLSAGRLDLRLLTPFVRAAGVTLAGTLSPRVSVSGPIADPRIDGELALERGDLRLRDPRVVATGVHAFAVLSPEQARITSLTGVVNGGALTGTGELRYGGAGPASARLTGRIAGMALEMPEGLRSELDVDAAVALADAPDGPQGRISGTVTVLRSAYREPLGVVTGLLNALRAERLAAAAAQPDAFASRLALDLRIVTDSDIVVDNNVAQLALGGDLRVIGTAAAPALSGRAELREGGQLFLGRNVYTIAPGSVIDFTDPVTIEPELNIEATTVAGGEEIALTLTGTAQNPEVALASPTDPQLGQADLASLLLTGRTLDQVPGAEAQIVGEQVVGYLSGDVLGLAGRALGLDTIRLGGPEGLRRDPGEIAAETDPTSRLTFGKSLGSNVDLTYSQSLRESGAQTWIVDYEPVRLLNLRLVARDDNLRSYEFRHNVELGGPDRAPRAERARDEREVADVTVDGETGLPEAQLRAVLRLRPGDTFDFSDWQRDRDRLEERLRDDGRLEARVAASRAEREDGVVLHYEVHAGPRTVLSVSGYQPSAETRQRIEEAWSQSIFDDFLEEEVTDIVRAALVGQGYLDAQITAAVAPGDPKTLQIAVEPGRRAVTRRVVIEAATEALAKDLEASLRARGLDAWRNPAQVVDAVAADLRARGYLRADVTAGAPRLDGDAAVLPLRVDAGPAFTLAAVSVEGAQYFSVDRLRATAGLAPGDRYDAAGIEAARSRIDAAYRREGFTSARTAVTAAPPEAAARARTDTAVVSVPVVFRVEEGPRQVTRDVVVRGNRRIDTDVITRALDLSIGEPLGAEAWLQARARLFDTGLFRRVDVVTEPLEERADAGAELPTRIVVTVEEWPALRLRYGFQLSEQRPEDEIGGRTLTPGVSADVTRRTLFGRAVTVGAAAEYQRRERLGRIFLNAPTMFGLPVESLLTAERSRRNFADATFITDLSGIGWEQRMRLGTSMQVSYAYRFERDHTFDTNPDPLFPFDVTATIARLTTSFVFDTRDDPYDTTRGSLFSSSFESAPASLGSEFLFLRHVGQAYHFRRWREVVFASAGQVGLVAPRGGQALLPSERFFGGGPRTLRGVEEDGLGPRDIFGDPAGGRALVVLNQEVRFPVYGWVRGVGFVDAGNVFRTPADVDIGRFVTAIGAGVRVNTPFALLRADWAHILFNRPDDARTVRWTFGIGHTF